MTKVVQRIGPAGRDLVVVLGISWLARAAFWVVFGEAQSNDVTHWLLVLDAIDDGRNPYETGLLNWPPLWLVVLVALDAVADLAHIPFVSALRAFLVLVESALLIALYRVLMSAGATREDVRRALLAGIALNPVAILLVIQHGNSDVIVGLFVVLAVGSLAAYARSRNVLHWLGGCLFLGLGVLAKTVPLVLVPILAPGVRLVRSGHRVLGTVLALGPAAIGTSVILALAPAAVLEHVLRYRSQGVYFGVWGVFSAWNLEGTLRALDWLWPIVFAGIVILLFVRLYGEPPPGADRLMLLAALLLMIVPVLGPAFAPQYAYWFLPAFVGTYVLLDVEWRSLLRLGYMITSLAYLWEYSLLPQYGGFAYRFAPDSEFLDAVGDVAASTGMHLLVRLPLFAVAVLLLVEGAKRLRHASDNARPVVSPPSGGRGP